MNRILTEEEAALNKSALEAKRRRCAELRIEAGKEGLPRVVAACHETEAMLAEQIRDLTTPNHCFTTPHVKAKPDESVDMRGVFG